MVTISDMEGDRLIISQMTELRMQFCTFCVIWMSLFFICVGSDHLVPPLRVAQGGPKKLKNNPWWKAEERLSGLHAVVVSVLGFLSVFCFLLSDSSDWGISSPPPYALYGAPHPNIFTYWAVRFSALGLDTFTSWMLTEMVIKIIVWKESDGVYDIKRDGVYFVHHICTFIGGTIARGLWTGSFELPMLVAAMLNLEWSTIPLVLGNLCDKRYDDWKDFFMKGFYRSFPLRIIPFAFTLWGLYFWWWNDVPPAVAISVFTGAIFALGTNIAWTVSGLLPSKSSKPSKS